MDTYLGEIAIFAFKQIPKGWLPCDGQTLQVSQYAALFSLLSTTYGGDGHTTFNLPDLRGRAVISQSTSHLLGRAGGMESVTLTANNIPAHTHIMAAVNAAPTINGPHEHLLSQSATNIYAHGTSAVQELNSGSMSITGGSAPHENRQPSIALTFCIATTGFYPTRP